MKTQKGISTIWILLIILLIASGGYFGYQYYSEKKSEKETQQPTQTAETTSKTTTPTKTKWATYTNQKIGFSFEYPKDWTYEESTFPQVQWENIKVSFAPIDFVAEVNPSASLAVLTHALEGYEKTAEEPITIDSVEAVKYTWQTTSKGKALYGSDYKTIYVNFTHNNDKFTLYINYKLSAEDQSKNFEHIISSFKFLASQPGASEGWTKYINKEVGYMLLHPKDWKIEEYNEYSETINSQVKNIRIYTDKYSLVFGIKKQGQSFAPSDRTGSPAGDFKQITQKTIKVLGVTVIPKALVDEGKIIEYFYEQPLGTDKICNCQFVAYFSSKIKELFKTSTFDVLDIPNKILESVQWLND